jgi:hypothetical protein
MGVQTGFTYGTMAGVKTAGDKDDTNGLSLNKWKDRLS